MKAELLAPAGHFEAIEAGCEAGADAFYIGLKTLNARMRAKNFSIPEVAGLVPYLHERKKKLYITLNTVVKNNELPTAMNMLYYLNDIKPDAIILTDLGLLRMIRTYFPDLPCHASTQFSVYNLAGVQEAQKLGFERVILARELSMNELRYISKNSPCELEVFVHGALCYSFAGMCSFSSYLGGKSGLRGACTQPCRRNFTKDGKKQFPYSTCDFNTIEYVPKLMSSGIKSFKIEGRLKDSDYVYKVVSAYRMVIDQGDKKIPEARKILESTMSRPQSQYFMSSSSAKVSSEIPGGYGDYIGKIKNKSFQKAVIVTKTAIAEGDQLRIQKSDMGDGRRFKLGKIFCNGVSYTKIDANNLVTIEIPFKFDVHDDIYKVGETDSENSKKFKGKLKFTIPPDYKDLNDKLTKLRRNHKQGADLARFMATQKKDKPNRTRDKSNFYFLLQNAENIDFILKKVENSHIIFELNQENKNYLLNNPHLIKRVNPSAITFSLFPIILDSEQKSFSSLVSKIIGMGFKNFCVENIAHLNFLREHNVELTAGINLRCFNNSTIQMFQDMKFKNILLHFENDQENFLSLLKNPITDNVIVPVFGAPTLFTSRIKTPPATYKSDDNEYYYTSLMGEISVTYPEKPFCFSKHIWLLKQNGARNFAIDLRNYPLNEGEILKLLYYMDKSKLLKNTKPFNFLTKLD